MKKENEFKVEALCGNCKNFVSAQNGKIYTRQAGNRALRKKANEARIALKQRFAEEGGKQ